MMGAWKLMAPTFHGTDVQPGKLEWMIRQAKSIEGK